MRLRFTVARLRISTLALSGFLALGVPAFAAYHYLGMGKKQPEPQNKVNKLHPAGTFVCKLDAGGPTGEDYHAAVARMVDIFIPARPAEASETKTHGTNGGEGPQAAAPQTPGEYPPGPLAAEPHNYKYSYFICREDPTRTQVWLEKAAPAGLPGALLGGGAPGSVRASPKLTAVGTAASRARRSAVGGLAQPSDRIHLYVWQREYSSDELGLHFWIHSADSERLVYWMHEDVDKPHKTLYALKYQSSSSYLEDPGQGLRPPEKQMAPGAQKPVKRSATSPFQPAGDTMETDYQQIFGGEKRLKDSTIFSDDARRKNQER